MTSRLKKAELFEFCKYLEIQDITFTMTMKELKEKIKELDFNRKELRVQLDEFTSQKDSENDRGDGDKFAKKTYLIIKADKTRFISKSNNRKNINLELKNQFGKIIKLCNTAIDNEEELSINKDILTPPIQKLLEKTFNDDNSTILFFCNLWKYYCNLKITK